MMCDGLIMPTNTLYPNTRWNLILSDNEMIMNKISSFICNNCL